MVCERKEGGEKKSKQWKRGEEDKERDGWGLGLCLFIFIIFFF